LVEKQDNGGDLSIAGISPDELKDYNYNVAQSIDNQVAQEANKETGEISMEEMVKLGMLKFKN